jgi:tetratricopeptide (TPR) repeat protein
MCYTRGELARARTALTRGLSLARDAGDTAMIAHAEITLGHVEHAGGNVDAALDRFSRSIEAFQALSIAWGVGNSLSAEAAVVLATGDIDRAERLLDQATSVLADAGPWFLAVTLYVRAIVAVRGGRPDESIAWIRKSLTRIRDLHDAFAFVAALVPLAAAAALKDDHAWTARILGARDAVIERTGIVLVDTPVRDLAEQAERSARARLGPERWGRAFAAGRSASIDSLLKEIDNAH